MIAVTALSTRRATPAGNITVDECAEMQAVIRDLPKRDAVRVIGDHLPHLSRSWINRNFAYVVELDPDALAVVLTYSDPTGEHAVNRAMKRGDARV